MLRVFVAFIITFTLIAAAPRVVAQEEEPCPAAEALLAATPGASPVGSPMASPTAEPKASPTSSPTVSPTASPTTAESCAVVMQQFQFKLKDIEIQVGTGVIWTNLDGARHTATADDGSFDTGLLSRDQSSDPIVFDTAGVFPYHCDEHPGLMKGSVTVT